MATQQQAINTNKQNYNILQRILDPRQQGAYDPTLAKASFGGFLNNAGNDISGLINGIVGLPAGVYNSVTSGHAGNDVVNTIKNLASGVNNAVGQPVAVKNGQVTGLQAPSAYQAVKSFYQNPVADVANLDILGGLTKGAIAKAGAKNAAESTAESTVKNTIPGGNASDIPNEAIQEFKSRYTFPQKRAADLKPIQTSQEILAHVKSGMNPDIIDQAPAMVTGNDGIVTQMTRDSLGKIKGNIDVGGQASKDAENILNATDNKMFTTPAEKQSIVNNILSGEEAGGKPLTMNPLDAYDYQRSLENIAAKYDFAAKNYLNPTKFADATKADAYHAAANAVGDAINKIVGDQGILDAVKTPERMQALEQISPRLARQVADAQNISELRHTASPFVKLSKMQDLTEQSGNSTFGKVAKGMSTPEAQPATALLSTLGAKLGGFPGYAAGKYSGNLVDRLFAPEINNMANKIEGPLQNAILKKQLGGIEGANAANPVINRVKSGFQAGVNLGPKALLNNSAQENQGGQDNNQPSDHNGNILSQTGSNVNSRYNFGNPYNSGVLLPETTKSQVANLQAQAKQASLNNPQQARNLDAQATALQGQYDAQNTLRTAWNGIGGHPGVAQLQQYGNETYNSVVNADPNLLNVLSKGYDSLQKASNGKYAAMATNLQALSNATGIDFTKASNKQALLSSIDSAMNLIKDQWQIAQQQFSGVSPAEGNQNPVMQAITPTQAPQSGGGIYRAPVDLNSSNGMDIFNSPQSQGLTGHMGLDRILSGAQ